MASSSIDDREYAPPATAPFPTGTSPFRQKGNGYLGDRRFLDSVVNGGYRAVVDAIADPAVRAFFNQQFRPSEWYDAYPGAVLEATAARLRGLPFEQHRTQTGMWHAADATKGIYGALIKLVSTENVALWGPRISAIYFEFGKTETRVAGPKSISGVRRGIPIELTQWVMYASIGFCKGALKAGGARNPVTRLDAVEPDGRAHGRDLVRVNLTLSWE